MLAQAPRIPGPVTPRLLARLLHGMGCPRCPQQLWRACAVWSRHAHVSFADTLRIAHAVMKRAATAKAKAARFTVAGDLTQ
jgi:hypothetical protein